MSGAEPVAGARIHLDANILILSARNDTGVRDELNAWQRSGAQFSASAMAWAEFCSGPASRSAVIAWSAALTRILPIDRGIAETAAALFNLTGRRSRSLPDCLIAAAAIHDAARLATRNRADFLPFVPHGLVLA